MCVTCGCSEGGEATLRQGTDLDQSDHEHEYEHEHEHHLPDGTVLRHHHGETHTPHTHPAAASSITLTTPLHGTTLDLEQRLLAKNDRVAAENREWLRDRQTIALNLVSSPGAGKTTLLVRTIEELRSRLSINVIEGDQATAQDAQRIQATGCNVVQINTGTGCHLDAAMVQRGLQALDPPLQSLVMIENVGNLVCPALFDLGERAKVVVLSVTEGEDKPIKYPHMFRASQVMVLTKIDLLPYLSFAVDRCVDYAHQVNPDIQIFQVSATTGTGLSAWHEWLCNLTP